MKLSITSWPLYGRYDIEKTTKLIADAGFQSIDWDICSEWDGSRAWKGDFDENGLFHKPVEEIIEFFKPEYDTYVKYGLSVDMAHAPFPLLVSDRPWVAEYTLEVMKKCIKFCSYYGVKNLVFHGERLNHWEKVKTQADIDNDNYEYLKALIPTLKGSGVVLCLENLFKTHPDRIGCTAGVFCEPVALKKLVEELNELAGEEVFGVCYDVGHMALIAESVGTFARVLGKHIKCLHLHDNDLVKDRHVLPMTGMIDWFDLVKGLKDGGYEGDINFETVHQYDDTRIPDELIPSFLRITAEIGDYIRKELQK